jgi:hypothetical protein
LSFKPTNVVFYKHHSKIDVDIDNAIYDCKDQEMIIPEIK